MNNERDLRLQYANKVKEAVQQTFNKKYYNVEVRNFGTAISVLTKNTGLTSIWIRLGMNSAGYMVNISSVQISKSLQHKGKFTNMMKDIAKLDFVKMLMVGSVCTEPMREWCNKYGFVDINGINDFVFLDK